MRKSTSSPCAVFVFLTWMSFSLLGSDVRADYEAVGFAVGNFGDPGECSGADSSHPAEYISRVYYYAVSSSYWDYDYVRPTITHSQNSYVEGHDFTDPDPYPWGEDYVSPQGSDFADTIFLSTHGHADCMELSDPYDESTGLWRCCGVQQNCYNGLFQVFNCNTHKYSRFTMGKNDGHCNVRTNDYAGNPGNIVFGDADANVFFVTSCNSVDPCVWSRSGYSDMDAGSFNTYMGFYGRHDYSTGGITAFNAYLSGTKTDHIGSDWLADEFYPNGEASPKGDVCPVVLIWGSSSSNCNFQYNNGGFRDFKSTGTHSISKLYWVGGCDPNKPGYNLNGQDRPALPDL